MACVASFARLSALCRQSIDFELNCAVNYCFCIIAMMTRRSVSTYHQLSVASTVHGLSGSSRGCDRHHGENPNSCSSDLPLLPYVLICQTF